MFIFNDYQLDRLSEILGNAGLLIWGSMVLPALIGIEKINPFVVLLDLVVGLGFIIASLFLLRRLKK